jgi:5-methylcytosine-specific restriction endonuclease McrBC regulatory subunit McrC
MPATLSDAHTLLMKVDRGSLNVKELYAHDYAISTARFFKLIHDTRAKHNELAKTIGTEAYSSETMAEMLWYMADSQNHLEFVYLLMHRLEILVRHGHLSLNGSDAHEIEKLENELYYVSEIRNKIFEHGAENFAHYSTWGEVANVSSTLDFRQWFLVRDVVSKLSTNENSIQVLRDVIQKTNGEQIEFPQDLINIHLRARELDRDGIKNLIKNCFVPLGCISHSPEQLIDIYLRLVSALYDDA